MYHWSQQHSNVGRLIYPNCAETDRVKTRLRVSVHSMKNTSVKGQKVQPSVVVNTKLARLERPLIVRCANDLAWDVDQSTDAEHRIVWLGTAIPDHEFPAFACPADKRCVINRFPKMQDLVRKRWLARVLQSFSALHPKTPRFFPKTYFLPEDIEKVRHSFNTPSRAETAKCEPAVYILKPDAGAQGIGLTLALRMEDIPASHLWGSQGYIVQNYISNPLTLGGKKFDIRIYVLVLKVSPELEAYVGTEGLARFCTKNYAIPDRTNSRNPFMHLTNFSVNKNNPEFHQAPDVHSPLNSKRPFCTVLGDLYNPSNKKMMPVWPQIITIVQETLLGLQPLLQLSYDFVFRDARQRQQNCFQILGFDILLDDTGRAWLLEVNSNPSLRTTFEPPETLKSASCPNKDFGLASELSYPENAENSVDHYVKYPLVKEALRLAHCRHLLSCDTNSCTTPMRSGVARIKQPTDNPTSCCKPLPSSTFPTFQKSVTLTTATASALLITKENVFASLRYWMPVALPRSEEEAIKVELQNNSEIIKYKNTKCDPDDFRTVSSCWAFLDFSLQRYTEAASHSLIGLCRQLFKKATQFPLFSVLNSALWETFANQSELCKMVSNVTVPCIVTSDCAEMLRHNVAATNDQVLVRAPVTQHRGRHNGAVPHLKQQQQLTRRCPRSERITRRSSFTLDLPFRHAATRQLSWPDLKWMFYRPLCSNPPQKPIRSYFTKRSPSTFSSDLLTRGLGFWSFWELLVQLGALVHTTQMVDDCKEECETAAMKKQNLDTALLVQDQTAMPAANPTLKCLKEKSFHVLDWWPDTKRILEKVLELDSEGLIATLEKTFQMLLHNLRNAKNPNSSTNFTPFVSYQSMHLKRNEPLTNLLKTDNVLRKRVDDQSSVNSTRPSDE